VNTRPKFYSKMGLMMKKEIQNNSLTKEKVPKITVFHENIFFLKL